MKRSTVVILVVVGVVLVLFFWFKNGYNSMVKEQEGVQTAWSQVENVYQRRADLIPNLVNTVKGYAAHESQTLEGVVNARAKATQLTVDPENLTPEKLAAYQEAQGELGAALGKLLAIQENYPDLKANENFLALQSQLEGTGNRISTERMKFNEAAKRYNVLIRVFPKSIIASLFGFEKMPYFQAKEGADVAPAVEF
jgi:LemA protein